MRSVRLHPEDQEAIQRLSETAARTRATNPRTPEELKQMSDDLDSDILSSHPALNPKTEENLTTLFQTYRKNAPAGLAKKFDQLFSKKE
jgi:hypothetical protein